MIKAVLDTNVFVSALIARGKPRSLLERGIDREFLLATSKEMLEELVGVLRRPKFRTSEDEIHRFVSVIARVSEIVKIKSDFDAVKNDPADNKVLNTAYDSKADYVVSGDDHLLKLGAFNGIRMASVDTMLKILEH